MKTNFSFLRSPFSVLLLAAAMVFAGCGGNEAGDEPPNVPPGVTPTLSVSPASISADVEAGNYTLTVTSNTSWAAVVEDAAMHAWCTITNGTKGGENGTITLHTTQNTVAEERYAIITVTAGSLTRQVTVTQAATAQQPLILEVDKTYISAASCATTHTFSITSNSTWTATVSAGATWCTVFRTSGRATGSATVSVAINTLHENRTASVIVTSGQLTRVVTVGQLPGPYVIYTTSDAPSHAASNKVWIFDLPRTIDLGRTTTTWSDLIQIPECNKEEHITSSTVPDCYSSTNDGKTQYFYNWTYVDTYKNKLCDKGWSVPNTEYYILSFVNWPVHVRTAWCDCASVDHVQNGFVLECSDFIEEWVPDYGGGGTWVYENRCETSLCEERILSSNKSAYLKLRCAHL
jgi:hypothetical protein